MDKREDQVADDETCRRCGSRTDVGAHGVCVNCVRDLLQAGARAAGGAVVARTAKSITVFVPFTSRRCRDSETKSRLRRRRRDARA